MLLICFLFSIFSQTGFVDIPNVNSLTQQSGYHSAARTTPVFRASRKVLRNISTRPFPVVRDIPWGGHFSAKNFKTPSDKTELSQIKKSIRTAVVNLPKEHVSILQNLEVKKERNVSRGMANRQKMILHTDSIDSNKELISVFVHEMGHLVDLGFFVGTRGISTSFRDVKKIVLSDDRSLRFYRLSWVSSKRRKTLAVRADFVSGYAMTDVFEDFAESYLFYRIHGEKFRLVMQESKILVSKYNFMKDVVFNGVEFQINKETDFVSNMIFDATLVQFEIGDFVAEGKRQLVISNPSSFHYEATGKQ